MPATLAWLKCPQLDISYHPASGPWHLFNLYLLLHTTLSSGAYLYIKGFRAQRHLDTHYAGGYMSSHSLHNHIHHPSRPNGNPFLESFELAEA
jgi:hypothetical protein